MSFLPVRMEHQNLRRKIHERKIRQARNLRSRATYAAPLERVYEAWANPEAKAKWFSKADIFDFQTGGREYSSGGPPEGPVYEFNAFYQEIIPEQHIVYSYTLDMGGKRVSVSIATIEFVPVEDGTRLVLTEQGAFFDGLDTPEIREQGTNELLDALGRALAEEA
jgi:uncharacterized protein YndB with AHSA1/START domain